VTPKSVLINFNSGSIYTDCDVYTGTTSTNITGSTYCTNMGTGQSCSLTGISASLLEIYVKLSCSGCCENTYRINLDDCCDSSDECCGAPPTSTPTVTPTKTVTPTVTPTITLTPTVTPTTSPTPTGTPAGTPAVTPSGTPAVTPTSTPGGTPAVTQSVTPTATPAVTQSVTPTPTSTNPCSCYDVENTTPPGGNPNGTDSIRFTYNDCSGDSQTWVLSTGQQGCICTLPIYYGSISVAWADSSVPPPSLGTNYTIVPMTGSGGCIP
jgi:hypothetical protein